MAGNTATGAARYAAFISYSHADSDVCDRLHKRLESYQIPHSLIGRAGPNGKLGRRLGKFFRDRVDLGAHHDLGAEIREALDNSAALIVLCSPRSAGSVYVAEEIRYFKALGRAERVFTAIISGEPHAAGKPGLTAADECFPDALIRRVGADGQLTRDPEPAEPVAADLRDRKDGLENGSLKLIAGLLDIGLDDLVQREKQAEARRRRQAYMISGAMGVLALGAGVGGVLAVQFGNEAAAKTVQVEEELGKNRKLSADLQVKLDENVKLSGDLARELGRSRKLTTQLSSIVGEITQLSLENPDIPDEVLFMAAGANVGASGEALRQLFRLEMGERQPSLKVSYYSFDDGPCIGFSFCLPAHTADAFRSAWSGKLPADVIEKIATTDWSDKEKAKTTYAEIQDASVSRKDAIRVFGDYQLPAVTERLRAAIPNVDELSPDSLGALVSLVWHAGITRVKNAVGKPMEERRFADIPEAIREDGRKLATRFGGAIGEAMIRRREQEAALFERGLQPPP